ncbi:uncharacterized protein [Elaeis guineensis]|uniref:uncharacterized protein n=1 Tax=Elaeis guineensis var. tenera TaxID=51953 RepID=UPI003C6D856F
MAAHEKWMEDDNKVKCYTLASMSNELHSQYEDMPTAKATMTYLQELYGEHSCTACFESLTSSFASFVMNYNMNKLNYTLPELMNMLISNEGTLKSSRTSTILAVAQGPSKRKFSWKKKRPMKKQKKEKKSKPKKKDTPKKAATGKEKYFHCYNDGY